MNNNEVYKFAVKWIEKFKDNNKNLHEIFETAEFPNDCCKIGFKMDCGESFDKKYSSIAFSELKAMKSLINQVDDIYALGNLIFSKWRWFNHSDYVVYRPEDEEWFIATLTKLLKLTND